MGCCQSQKFICCIALDEDESVIVQKLTGKGIRHGRGFFFIPVWWDTTVVKSIALQNNQYLVVRHMVDSDDKLAARKTTGSYKSKEIEGESLNNDPGQDLVEIIAGPMIYRVRNPYDRVSDVQQMINLSTTQYIVVTDKSTGEKRVAAGPQLFCPKPYDEMSAVKDVFNLSSTEYIVVTDESTGEKRTIIGKMSN